MEENPNPEETTTSENVETAKADSVVEAVNTEEKPVTQVEAKPQENSKGFLVTVSVIIILFLLGVVGYMMWVDAEDDDNDVTPTAVATTVPEATAEPTGEVVDTEVPTEVTPTNEPEPTVTPSPSTQEVRLTIFHFDTISNSEDSPIILNFDIPISGVDFKEVKTEYEIGSIQEAEVTGKEFSLMFSVEQESQTINYPDLIELDNVARYKVLSSDNQYRYVTRDIERVDTCGYIGDTLEPPCGQSRFTEDDGTNVGTKGIIDILCESTTAEGIGACDDIVDSMVVTY